MEETAEQKLKRLTEKQNERSMAYYNKKKELINEKRRANYISKKVPVETKLQKYENNIYFQFINNLDVKETTKNVYRGNLCRVLDLIQDNDLLVVLKNNNELTKLIENSSFAFATKKGMMMCVLTILNNMGHKLTDDAFKQIKLFLDVLDREIFMAHSTKQQEESVMSFNEYIEKVKERFSIDSKMYLIAKLYDECTLRDDFQLQLVKKAPKILKHNYLVLNKMRCKIIVTQYKTEQQYGVISVVLTKELSDLLKTYISTNKLEINDYLFDDLLSKYIIYHNSLIGVKGGVSLYRKMKVSEILNNPTISTTEKVLLSARMAHSPAIQLTYLRNLNEDTDLAV